MAEDGELGKGAGQVDDTGAFSGRGIDSHGNMVPLSEDGLDEASQSSPRADLDKGAHPGGIHRFDLGDEFHRPCQLAGEECFCRCRFDGIGGCGGVGVDRYQRLSEVYIFQCLMKRCDGRRDEGAVESGARKPLAGEAANGKSGHCPFYFAGASRQDRLGRGVAVRYD